MKMSDTILRAHTTDFDSSYIVVSNARIGNGGFVIHNTAIIIFYLIQYLSNLFAKLGTTHPNNPSQKYLVQYLLPEIKHVNEFLQV